MADMLFDTYDYHYYLGYRMVPLFGDRWSGAYDPSTTAATGCFVLGALFCAGVYAKILSNPDRDTEAWGMPLDAFKQLFIGFWILKDTLWIQTAPHRQTPYKVG